MKTVKTKDIFGKMTHMEKCMQNTISVLVGQVNTKDEIIKNHAKKIVELSEQLDEANELLHHLFKVVCDEDDFNEITDYFDKWEV